jgi:hypothetical protein
MNDGEMNGECVVFGEAEKYRQSFDEEMWIKETCSKAFWFR